MKRIIYLGSLGDDADPTLSRHLRSRHEVGQILGESGEETIEFRASLVDLVLILTPYLSSLWLALVTPAAFEVGRHLIEGLKNPTILLPRNGIV